MGAREKRQPPPSAPVGDPRRLSMTSPAASRRKEDVLSHLLTRHCAGSGQNTAPPPDRGSREMRATPSPRHLTAKRLAGQGLHCASVLVRATGPLATCHPMTRGTPAAAALGA